MSDLALEKASARLTVKVAVPPPSSRTSSLALNLIVGAESSLLILVTMLGSVLEASTFERDCTEMVKASSSLSHN